MSDSNTVSARRESEALLKRSHGIRFYPTAKRCPLCGGRYRYRRQDKVCMHCAIQESKSGARV